MCKGDVGHPLYAWICKSESLSGATEEVYFQGKLLQRADFIHSHVNGKAIDF